MKVCSEKKERVERGEVMQDYKEDWKDGAAGICLPGLDVPLKSRGYAHVWGESDRFLQHDLTGCLCLCLHNIHEFLNR